MVDGSEQAGGPAAPTVDPTGMGERNWVWFSTEETAEAGKTSVLAIIETLGAMAAYAWIAWEYGTLHLTIAACVAPFLLLRTEESTRLARK